jgi:hypothetical protein
MCQFAADQAEIAGTLTLEPDEKGKINDEIMLQLPEVSTKDISRTSASASQLIVSLINAVDMGWLTNEKAAEAYAKVLSELNIKIDSVNEIEEAMAEKDEAEIAVATSQNGQLQGRLNGEPEEVE